jgi:hypothetical protein
MGFADQVARVDRSARKILGGEPVVYRIGGGGGAFSPAFSAAFAGVPSAQEVTVIGIFDMPYLLSQGDEHAGVGVATPSVFLRRDELPSDPEFDDPLLTIRGVVYRVVGGGEPDGLGGITLRLRENG